jgi:hypothetical protein
LDEPLPGQRSLIFEQSQFLLGRIGKARPRQSRISRQQAGLYDALELDKFGRGLTFAKLAACQYVMEVLGDLPLRVAYERLAGMVRMLGEDVQAMALRNAYAIDMPVPDTLTRRRERIAGIHGLSIDTIELYERNMIDELALRLVHGELPVGS